MTLVKQTENHAKNWSQIEGEKVCFIRVIDYQIWNAFFSIHPVVPMSFDDHNMLISHVVFMFRRQKTTSRKIKED